MKLSNQLSLLALAAILASCSGLGRMQKNAEEVRYTIEPMPLKVRGDKVALDIAAYYPARYFDRKSALTLTPQLHYDGAKVSYKSVTVQGERFAGNHQVISWEEGGQLSYDDVVAFKGGMENAKLILHAEGTRGKKEKVFEDLEIGVGVITTPYLLQNDDRMVMAPHGFERITRHQERVVINYLVNSSVVRSSELRDEDVKRFKEFAARVSDTTNIRIIDVVIEAHASPEGELRLNEDLADDRAGTARKVIHNILRREKVDDTSEDFYNEIPKGEDWLGFKEKMQASDIEDKALILRILTMYDDLTKREQEIRNLAKTYTEIADKILPELRRSQVTVNYELVGRTDEQLVQAVKTNLVDLNLQEILYAATLIDDASEKIRIYNEAADLFPEAYEPLVNAGYVQFMEGNTDLAKAAFESALKRRDNPYAYNNLGVIQRLEGERDIAKDHFESALELGTDVQYNIALIDVQNGEYGTAVNNFGSAQTFNSALAHHLNDDNESALAALATLSNNGDAMVPYLEAIIYAEQNNESKMLASLRKAVEMDPALKSKAASDMAFYFFHKNASFQSVVQ